jgi:hypothetical protein
MWLPAAQVKHLQSRLRTAVSQISPISGKILAEVKQGGRRLNSLWQQWLAAEATQRKLADLRKLFFAFVDNVNSRLPSDRRLF